MNIISSNLKLSTNCITELDNTNIRIDWNIMCKNQILSEQSIEKHIDEIKAENIIRYQKLTDDFIIKYVDSNKFQTVSERLLMRYIDNYGKDELSILIRNQNISEDLMKSLMTRYGYTMMKFMKMK